MRQLGVGRWIRPVAVAGLLALTTLTSFVPAVAVQHSPERRCSGAPFRLPVDGYFGWTWRLPINDPSSRDIHTGVDVLAPAGSPVYPPAAGVVQEVKPELTGLNLWFPDVAGGTTVYMTHIDYDPEAIKVGTTVDPSRPIGTVADYDPPHIHLSVAADNGASYHHNDLEVAQTQDPSPYFAARLNHDAGDLAFQADDAHWSDACQDPPPPSGAATACQQVFAAGWQDQGIYSLDLAGERILSTAPTSLFNNRWLAWNGPRQELYVAGDNGGVVSILKPDPLRETEVIEDGVGWNAHSIAVDPEGDAIYATFSTGGDGDVDRRLVVLDPSTRTSTHDITLDTTWGPAYLALSPAGDRLYVSWDDQLDIYDTSTMFRIDRIVGVTTESGRLIVSADGRSLFVVQPRELIKYDIDERRSVANLNVGAIEGGWAWVQLSRDGRTVWVAGDDGIHQSDSDLSVDEVILPVAALGFSESIDGSALVASVFDGAETVVVVVDLANREIRGELDVPDATGLLVAPCPGERIVSEQR